MKEEVKLPVTNENGYYEPSITMFIRVLDSIAIFSASIQMISPPHSFNRFRISTGEASCGGAAYFGAVP